MKTKWLIIAGVGVFIAIAAIFGTNVLRGNNDTHPSSEIVPVTRHDIGATVLATGIIKPMVGAEVKVGSRISGVVNRLRSNIGDYVKAGQVLAELDDAEIKLAKQWGFSDRRISYLTNSDERDVRERRFSAGIRPVYKRVDTCAGEFESFTPYLYSSYEIEDEADPQPVKKVMILGSGPNRIGQGIEFDYCCCHASFALREESIQSIMVNCNPETVSTDYDTSDRLYFEPLTLEDVLEVDIVDRGLEPREDRLDLVVLDPGVRLRHRLAPARAGLLRPPPRLRRDPRRDAEPDRA